VPLLYIWFFAKKIRKSLKTRKIPKKFQDRRKLTNKASKRIIFQGKIFRREQISQKKYRKSTDNKENIKIKSSKVKTGRRRPVKLIQKKKSRITYDLTMEKSRISFYLQILH